VHPAGYQPDREVQHQAGQQYLNGTRRVLRIDCSGTDWRWYWRERAGGTAYCCWCLRAGGVGDPGSPGCQRSFSCLGRACERAGRQADFQS